MTLSQAYLDALDAITVLVNTPENVGQVFYQARVDASTVRELLGSSPCSYSLFVGYAADDNTMQYEYDDSHCREITVVLDVNNAGAKLSDETAHQAGIDAMPNFFDMIEAE